MSVRALLSVLFQVNENFAIDLIAEQPVSQVGSRVISCDGGGGALGHPRVYINLVTCCLAPAPVPVLFCPRWPHTLGSAWPVSHPLGRAEGVHAQSFQDKIELGGGLLPPAGQALRPC